MLSYQEALRAQVRAIKELEIKGLTKEEIDELMQEYVAPADQKVKELVASSMEWSKVPDPWVSHREFWNDRELWTNRNAQLQSRWERLRREIQRPSDDMEMRLDDATEEMLDWLENEYKVPPYAWKTPRVNFVAYEGDQVKLSLGFHVDNIRLEHDLRARRVKTELARQIREQFLKEGIW
jgi:DNA-binding transcriptional MerR regulator